MTNSIRNNWDRNEIIKIYEQPFNDLIFQAQTIHRQYFNANSIQLSTLFSLKTGSCSQDCKYCAQSAHYKTDLKKERLVEMEKVLDAAEVAFANGASRFCMGAAWKNPAPKDMPYLIEIIKKVKSLGLQTCMTLGKLNEQQCQQLADAGLDYYNHNVNTSREYHDQIVTTHSYDDRLETLDHVRESGMKVCCGGIVGMGEKKSDRFSLLKQLANMLPHPDSVPINMLIKIKGTPLDNVDDLDWNEFIRTIATARILMPKSYIRLSAGRESMNEQMQSLAFLAGANSIFYGSKLLTTENNQMSSDNVLLGKLNIQIEHDCLLNSD